MTPGPWAMRTVSCVSRMARSSARSAARRGSILPKSRISQKGVRHMVKVDPTVSTLSAVGALAVATSVVLKGAGEGLGEHATSFATASAHAAEAPPPRPAWAASATGRVEPKDGEVRITSQVPGRIVEVAVKANDQVAAGALLVRLDDDELRAKLVAAEAEVLVREREREEEAVKGAALERRQAEDAASASERAVFSAQLAL